MGLARFAYNSVVKWSKRCYFTKEDDIKKKKYINPMNHQHKLSLFSGIRAAIWGERKFLRAVVRLGMQLRGTVNVSPVNITDEAIDEALTARNEVINRNTQRAQ